MNTLGGPLISSVGPGLAVTQDTSQLSGESEAVGFQAVLLRHGGCTMLPAKVRRLRFYSHLPERSAFDLDRP
jgi:hypothetical protein